MQSLFITATNTDVGKTYTTLKLIKHFVQIGLRVGVYKPIETGVIDLPHDASLLLGEVQKTNPRFRGLTTEDITAYTFPLPSAPFCADRESIIDIEKIVEKYYTLQQKCDILLVEGAGGLLVPIKKDFMMIDLIKKLNIPTLLVTPSKLGCINDTLLSIEALKNRDIEFDWCVNLYQDREDFDRVTKPFYDEVFVDWWCVDDGFIWNKKTLF
ncbi:MAG: dethiobiotin synthase [Sulfurovum sp.]